MLDEKKYHNWPGLVEYTKEFKEWIWKLFRKVHARIGHVEEELAKVREKSNVNYQLAESNEIIDGKYEYVLYDANHPEEYHGKIVIDVSSGIQTVNWYDGDQLTGAFTRVYRWEGSRGDWETNIHNPYKWTNCLVFGNIIENNGNITKYIWAGNNEYSYEANTIYWNDDEIDTNIL